MFPAVVLHHALAKPLPRLAVERYWQAHPVRADRLARGLVGRGRAPEGWQWTAGTSVGRRSPRGFRAVPAPFREPAHHLGPGHCCICGQPVYRFGWHVDLWGDGRTNRRAAWHACCVVAWKLWHAPQDHGVLLRRLQKRRCAATGKRLLRSSDVDHRIPLFQVWRDRRDEPWPTLLRFWGIDNLQVINRPAHVLKSALEAGERAETRRRRSNAAERLAQGASYLDPQIFL